MPFSRACFYDIQLRVGFIFLRAMEKITFILDYSECVNSQTTAVTKIAAAVICRALQDALKPECVKIKSRRGRCYSKNHMREQSRQWLLYDRSFDLYCDLLGLDPEFMRRKIIALIAYYDARKSRSI